MSLEQIASGLFNFDPTRGLAVGTQMGSTMMDIALREQAMKFQVAADAANAQLSGERNALARRSQMFNELTENLNRFDRQAAEQQAGAFNQGLVDRYAGGGSPGFTGGSSVSAGSDYPGQGSPTPVASAEPQREFSYSDAGDFNTVPSEAPAASAPAELAITMNQPTPIGAGGATVQAPEPSFSTAPAPTAPVGGANPATIQGSASARMEQRRMGREVNLSGRAAQPRNDFRRAPAPVSFAGGPSMTPNVTVEAASSIPDVPVFDGAHRIRVDVPFDGTPANIRYNNPGASYPRPRDNAFGLEGYGVIGGGHLIGKYPTPVHGAASNMDLFSKSYTGMTIQGAVNKWRGGNGSLNVPDGYSPSQVIDEKFVTDRDTMTDFFQKMSAHESSRFSMPSDQWGQAFDLYAAGGIQGRGDSPAPPVRDDVAGVAPATPDGGINAGLFPQPDQQQAARFYGPQEAAPTATPPTGPEIRLPEQAAAEDARKLFQANNQAKVQSVQKLSELRTREVELADALRRIDSRDPFARMQANQLTAQYARVRSSLEAAEELHRGILEREKITGQSLIDAEAALKVASDRQRGYQRAVPDAGIQVSPEDVFNRYVDADPRTRMQMKASFVGDDAMMKRLAVADDYLKSQGGTADDRVWKIGGSEYTLKDLVEFYDPNALDNSVSDFVNKDPKLRREVEAAKGAQSPAESGAPANGVDPVKAGIDKLF